MTAELEAIARRWAALPGFRWREGMQDAATGLRYDLSPPGGHLLDRCGGLPDLDDDATFGLLIVEAYTTRQANRRSADFDFARVSRVEAAEWCVGLLEKEVEHG